MEYAYEVVDFIQAVGWALVPLAGAGALHSVSQYYQSKADYNDITNDCYRDNAKQAMKKRA